MLHPTVFNVSQVCYQLGIRHVVLSPGSRNAPLIISFARNMQIEKYVIPDERSAGFIALGVAWETKCPVVVTCTSGTALLNYAPAVAEAFYREIPLIVLSADRPPELIDQRDGQTIRQFEVLKNHVKKSFQLPVIKDEDDAQTFQKDLINGVRLSQALPKGPVHINIPFKEPFYPTKNQELIYKEIKGIKVTLTRKSSCPKIDIPVEKKVLILVGQQDTDDELNALVKRLSVKVPVIKTPLNNLQNGINHVDTFIRDQKELTPDILLTSGLSVLSKNLKVFLRKNSPSLHYHFDPAGVEVDTYHSSPLIVKQPMAEFLTRLKNYRGDEDYLIKWKRLEEKAKEGISSYLQAALFSETRASHFILHSIPSDAVLHLSNSMPVRFGDIFGVPKGVRTLSNRGTSGIDGCTSTALGTALASKRLNILVTGDLAFLYDRNAFFHNYGLSNLRIVIMNNQGGGIFRLIEGPPAQPELETYFETRHNRTAAYICKENKFGYFKASRLSDLENQWREFLKDSNKTKILEIFTEPEINQKEYKKLSRYINERVGN
ncbi:MAG: 2-succinyl-5-enolpyruvyl-6-hydroxy-3-cyclohexene-1-carboxylic-acid synthase [Ekhidna sp.]|nr:2-succinyl-5-enolpyruvyl-6-hydroxy-3-cyclohexene-1-carboxylic-acid synthase [Ekhidna sp.]